MAMRLQEAELVQEIKNIAKDAELEDFSVQSTHMSLVPPGIGEQDCAKALKYVINKILPAAGRGIYPHQPARGLPANAG